MNSISIESSDAVETGASYADLNELKVLLLGRFSDEQLQLVDAAWDLARKIHVEEKHFSGIPYLEHLFDVAHSLASMDMDLETVLGGILHGVMHGGVSFAELQKSFGEDIATIVDGVSRITRIANKVDLSTEVEDLRRMMLAIATDIRVLLVRLVDRLQDMSSLESVDRELQFSVAQETMKIYAPLASRLGIEWLKKELEDLSFRYLYPEAYKDLETKMHQKMAEGQAYVDRVLGELNAMLGDGEIYPIRVYGRPKHLYSIYKKLIAQNIPLERVYDKIAFRIIVNSVPECYGALGLIHSHWTPIQQRIKDFISVPKANKYQSLHTTVLGPDGQYIEIQIRTKNMDRIAQEGVAAHWAYKEGAAAANANDAKLFRELKKLVAKLQEIKDPREYMNGVMEELYSPKVYVVTPKGEVKGLPVGSCPIDLAYSIHSQIGDHCVGAKIGGRQVSLKYRLQNGDIVEILTSGRQSPKAGWLDFVKTGRAKSCVRAWVRSDEREQERRLGEGVCEQELRNHGISLRKIEKNGQIQQLVTQLRCNSVSDLFIKIGRKIINEEGLLRAISTLVTAGKHNEFNDEAQTREMPSKIISAVKDSTKTSSSTGVIVDGTNDILIKIAQCCRPLPGDEIIGYVTLGNGVSVHKVGCSSLKNIPDERQVKVSWNDVADTSFSVPLYLMAEDYAGLFADVAGVITSDDANIIEVKAYGTPGEHAEMRLVIGVKSVRHLQTIMQHIQQLPEIRGIYRM